MSYLMKTFSVSYNPVGITNNSRYRTARYFISIEHKVYLVLPGFVWNERHVVFPGRSWSHIHRYISRGATTLDGQFP